MRRLLQIALLPSSNYRLMAGAVSKKSERKGSLLEEINIRSLGLIDSATIEFKEGFNVITGETGAGKTMLLNALSLILGQKPMLITSDKARREQW